MSLNVKRNMEKTKKGLNDLKAKVVLSPLFNRLAVPIVVIGAIVASGCTGTDGVDTVVNGIEGGVDTATETATAAVTPPVTAVETPTAYAGATAIPIDGTVEQAKSLTGMFNGKVDAALNNGYDLEFTVPIIEDGKTVGSCTLTADGTDISRADSLKKLGEDYKSFVAPFG